MTKSLEEIKQEAKEHLEIIDKIATKAIDDIKKVDDFYKETKDDPKK